MVTEELARNLRDEARVRGLRSALCSERIYSNSEAILGLGMTLLGILNKEGVSWRFYEGYKPSAA